MNENNSESTLDNDNDQETSWNVFQGWRDLLFASWRIPVEKMRPLVPSDMTVDTFDGSAWISLVPMKMSDLHFKHLPPLPGLDHFLEINLRTYVRVDDEPGVHFFSIDCNDLLSDWYASHFLKLPCLRAAMTLELTDGAYVYESHRTAHKDPPGDLIARYAPVGAAFETQPGSLEHFLVERYAMFFPSGKGSVLRGEMKHNPWQVQRADVDLMINTIPRAAGFEVGNRPDAALYAQGVDTYAWPVTKESE